jgi:hypothetical protein
MLYVLIEAQASNNETIICIFNFSLSRSQWQRGLGHEMSSPAQTLASWVRIPLEA